MGHLLAIFALFFGYGGDSNRHDAEHIQGQTQYCVTFLFEDGRTIFAMADEKGNLSNFLDKDPYQPDAVWTDNPFQGKNLKKKRVIIKANGFAMADVVEVRERGK